MIFLIKGGAGKGRTELERLPGEPYEDEDLLQRLVDEHPEILPGEQIDPEDPVRWFPITREAGIPDSENSGSRWAVDHLLLDQHGWPTLVECKRSSDPRLRREVVGQMLDYAAHAQVYWPLDRIRALAAERYGGSDAVDQALVESLSLEAAEDPAAETEVYWQQVADNLRSGRVRLLFVADKLPRELRRVIEFLNAQMPNVEVLGVEIRQYLARDLRVLVPRLVGQTEYARREQSRPSPRALLSREEFWELMPPGQVRDFFEEFLARAQAQGLVPDFTSKGCALKIRHPGEGLRTVAYLYPPGMQGNTHAEIWPYMGYLHKLGEDTQRIRQRLLDKAPFEEGGSYTLRWGVTPDNLRTAKDGLAEFLAIMGELRSRWESANPGS